MELSTLISTFCIVVPFLLSPCSSDDQVNVQKSLKEYGNFAVQQDEFSLPSLPRKLKLQEDGAVKGFGDKDIMQHKKLLEASSANKQNGKQENVVAARKGTWREWVEAPNKSEYFTMDYSGVRRRRPIHNKQLPFVP